MFAQVNYVGKRYLRSADSSILSTPRIPFVLNLWELDEMLWRTGTCAAVPSRETRTPHPLVGKQPRLAHDSREMTPSVAPKCQCTFEFRYGSVQRHCFVTFAISLNVNLSKSRAQVSLVQKVMLNHPWDACPTNCFSSSCSTPAISDLFSAT